MRLGNELRLVFHNTVHSYCGLGLPHFFAPEVTCLIFHHASKAPCLCGSGTPDHWFSTTLSTVIVGWTVDTGPDMGPDMNIDTGF